MAISLNSLKGLLDILLECRPNQRIIGYLIYFLSENKSNVQ